MIQLRKAHWAVKSHRSGRVSPNLDVFRLSYLLSMLISAPTEVDVPSNLSAKLRTLPTLIDVYVLLVDRVMRKHGFDQGRCEFVPERALPRIEDSHEESIQISEGYWPEVSRLDFISTRLKAAKPSNPEPTIIWCESDVLLAAS